MPRHRPQLSLALPAAFVLAAVLAGHALAAPTADPRVRYTAGDKDTKPEDPALAPARVLFDCSGRDTFAVAPDWTLTVVDTTAGGPTDLDGYTCIDWPEAGPEHVYRLEVSDDVEFWAGLSGITEDLDLFLLGDCDTEACLVGANTELAAALAPGTYFLVVDSYGSGAPPGGPYVLDMEARWPGVPPGPCEPASSPVVVCSDLVEGGNLFGQPDLIRTYDCNPSIHRGGENWFVLDIGTMRSLSLTTTPQADGLDLALWLFDGCGADAVCLEFVDENLARTDIEPGTESLTWVNDTDTPVTLLLAVDCTNAPPTVEEGLYELLFGCVVPGEKTSFGDLRALYR